MDYNYVSTDTIEEIRQAVADAHGFATWDEFEDWLHTVHIPAFEAEQRKPWNRIKRFYNRRKLDFYRLLIWMGYEFSYDEPED